MKRGDFPVRPIAVAGGVFASGFGGMYLFWRSGQWKGSPGLFDYRSATWGDGILLPLAAGALTYSISRLAATRRDRLWSAIAGFSGAMAGVATQVAWLKDPDPQTNWTLSEPHHFNAPGWYHAVFLVAASGLFPALWAAAVSRLVGAGADSSDAVRKAATGAGLAFAAQGGFALLVVHDNMGARGTDASRSTLLALSLGVAGVIGLAALGVLRRRRTLMSAAQRGPDD